MYLFQHTDYASFFLIKSWPGNLIFNRFLRFVINDLLVLLLIYGLFARKEYIVLALWVQLFGLVFILIPYLYIKVSYPSYTGAFFSFLHRLVVNPLLLLLVIPAIFYMEVSRLSNNNPKNE